MCVTVWVACTHFLSLANRVTGKPWQDLAGHHEEQTVRGAKLETGHCCYKILNISLTDNYLKSLTGSLIIIITTATTTTKNSTVYLSYFALVILFKTAAALCRKKESSVEWIVAEATLFPSFSTAIPFAHQWKALTEQLN